MIYAVYTEACQLTKLQIWWEQITGIFGSKLWN